MSIVKSIRIQNFKSLEDVKIDLSQLTLLFGANSSGKSSFLKALMFLSRNYDIDQSRKVHYDISNDMNLDGFNGAVFNHDAKRNIEIGLAIECSYRMAEVTEDLIATSMKNNLDLCAGIEAYKVPNFKKYSIDCPEKRFNCTVNFKVHGKPHKTFGKGFGEFIFLDSATGYSFRKSNRGTRFDFGDNDFEQLFYNKWKYNYDFLASSIISPYYNIHDTVGMQSEDWEKLSDEDKIKQMYKMLEFTCMFELVDTELRKFLNLKHLGITREIPIDERICKNLDELENDYYGFLKLLYDSIPYEANYDPLDLYDFSIFDKKNFSDSTVAKVDDVSLPITKTVDSNIVRVRQLFEFINFQLQEFGFDQIYRVFMNDNVFSFKLQDRNGNFISFGNSSSGLTQLFPIIVAFAILREQSAWAMDKYMQEKGFVFNSLLLEQPELHLHPKLQSQLAELLSETMPYLQDDSNIFIETHSEHLIRKLQVLIAKGELSRKKVKVYYFYKENGVTKRKKMELDENGLFKEDWPKGFFDESIDLTMELFKAIKIRKN